MYKYKTWGKLQREIIFVVSFPFYHLHKYHFHSFWRWYRIFSARSIKEYAAQKEDLAFVTKDSNLGSSIIVQWIWFPGCLSLSFGYTHSTELVCLETANTCEMQSITHIHHRRTWDAGAIVDFPTHSIITQGRLAVAGSFPAESKVQEMPIDQWEPFQHPPVTIQSIRFIEIMIFLLLLSKEKLRHVS